MDASDSSKKALQAFLSLIGIVAVVAGGATVLLGVGSVIGAEGGSAAIDSEIRFYAVWYVGAGLLLLRDVRRVETAAFTVRAVATLFFVAGCGRLISLATVGTPHRLTLVLMVIELLMPVVLIPWQTSVARRHGAFPSG